MSTQTYNRTYNIPFTFNDILRLVQSLTVEDKLRIEQEIEKETLLFRARKLDEKIPENPISIDEIAEEVREYRERRDEKQ
ncbi:MAG: hypothetical protein IH598_16275 [Bacteroidales bacterium]|jgi:hypothetical protein|nr:hypothetical protein [Bacteroidales bacterium]